MAMTEKRTSVCLSKEDLRLLIELQECLGESKASIMRRALQYYYQYQSNPVK